MFYRILLCVLLFGNTSLYAQPLDHAPILDFSLSGGFFSGKQTLEIRSPGCTIFYTTDGSTPDRSGNLYKRPIQIQESTVVRALAISPDGLETETSHTYFIDEPASSFPVISIAITPAVLFDPVDGLYVKGEPAFEEQKKSTSANFWSKREVPMHCEIFETDKQCVFRSKAGLRLFGGYSRLFPQKSLTIITSPSYGEKRIEYPLFGPEGPDKFKFLVLRNSGSDFGKSHFRDALMTSLVEDWDMETQAYRPAHVYLNGKYWGIYNMREKINRHFLETHTDIDKDSVDILEHYMGLKKGSVVHYRSMLAYLRRNDLSDQYYFDSLGRMMDIDNFMNYQLAQIYFDNQDAGGNIKFWRPQRPDGIWRWVLYDTDWGFGLHNENAQEVNSLAFHTRPDGPSWPNPPWSTFILRKLLENPGFRQAFINRMADHLNTAFHPDRVLDRINSMETALLPEIDRHLERWNLSRKSWIHHVQRLKRFAFERPSYVRSHFKETLEAGNPVPVRITCQEGGSVWVNENLILKEETLDGIYFANVPVKLEALPRLGYRFTHWVVDGQLIKAGKLKLTLKSETPRTIEAFFQPYLHPLAGKLIINEICPFNEHTGDWVELFNNSDEIADLTGWQLIDLKRNHFYFPPISVPPKSYLVVCQDSVAFGKSYPKTLPYLGGLTFGLHKRREKLFLYSNNGAAIDSVGYNITPMDTSFSLSLLLPHLNNADQENWTLDPGNGTPNKANPEYYLSFVEPQQEQWMRLGAATGLFLLLSLLITSQRRRKHPYLHNKK